MPALTVIGGGPAGLAAATAASRLGVSTTLVDENSILGGQYYRQPRGPRTPRMLNRTARQGAGAIAAAERAGAEALLSATAFSAQPGRVDVDLGTERRVLHAGVLVASGTTERVVPIPGWTLPRVVTCGAAQALLKMHHEPVGHRVVVAGSGPFLLPVAAALVRVGAVVVAVIEAEPFGRRAVSAICRQPSVAAEALRCGWTLAAARSRLRTGYGVARIADRAGGLSVAIAKLDRNGAPRGAQLETLECDAVCLSDGFVPSVDLGQLAGARLQFAPLSRTWAIAANPQTGRTGVDGLWAAGACLNPWAGARLATASGDAAGRDAASALLGRPPEPPPRELSTALTFSRRLAAAFPTKPDWYSRTADDVVVCRCENVDAGAIRRAAKTAADVNAVKHLTRAGMGVCQGRTCQAAVAELTARAGGDTIEAVSHFHARSPVRPITTAVLAGGESDGSGSAASRSRAPTGRH